MTNEILTIETHSGFTALAKQDRFGLHVKCFANRTQAEKAAREVGGVAVQPRQTRVFYVMVKV